MYNKELAKEYRQSPNRKAWLIYLIKEVNKIVPLL